MFTKFCELPCAASQHQYVAYSSRCQFCYFALLLMKPNYDVTHILWRNDLVEGSWMQARLWNKVGTMCDFHDFGLTFFLFLYF